MINTPAIIGQLIASRFPRAISGYLLADWDGYYPYDYIKSDVDIATDGGTENIPGIIATQFGWLSALNCNNLTNLITYGANTNRIFITNCNNLTNLNLWGSGAYQITINGCNSLTTLTCTNESTRFKSLDLSNAPSLITIDCDTNCLSTLIIPSISNISGIDVSSCQLTQTVVDNIVTALLGSSVNGGILNVGGSSQGVPSAIPTLNANYTTLTTTKSWTVYHN